MAARGPDPTGARGWTVLLVALALTLPLGALLQPWLLPSRSSLPGVPRRLDAPVVLITVAGLRADRLHHLGYPRETTPALDALARHGVSFSRCFAASNDAIATLGSVLTAACPARNGLRSAEDALSPDVETLAGRFARNDYLTLAAVAHPEAPGRGLERGFARYEALPAADAETVLASALELLEGAPDNRFFLWVDLADLLPPYGGPALDVRRFAPEAPAGFGADPSGYGLDVAARAARGWGARETAWMEARYDAAVLELDAAIGGFLARLDEAMLLPTMLLIVTGTAGERLAEPEGLAFSRAAEVDEASLRVPLIVHPPAKVVRGLVIDHLASSVDLGPTLAGKLGGRFGWPGTMGHDLDLAIRFRQNPRKAALSEGWVRRPGEAPWRAFVMRLADHKYVTDGARTRGRLTLPASDPGERQPQPLSAIQVQALEQRGGEAWAACARD